MTVQFAPAASILDSTALTPVKVQAADLFCGAGGFSTALIRALEAMGIEVELVCLNHWERAIQTHLTNHPQARHFQADIHSLRPIVAVPSGKLHILLAAPTCTDHSGAKGGQPINDQQRMHPWAINTWATELDVDIIVCENVPEIQGWGPLKRKLGKDGKPLNDRHGRPWMVRDPARKGEYYRAWIASLRALDYQVEWRVICAADYGDATTRKRWIMQARKDGHPITWPERTHAPANDNEALGLKPWVPASAIIDWSRRGRCVFGRKIPLRPNTIRRVIVGVQRHFGWMAALYLPALELELQRSIARHGDKGVKKGVSRGGKPSQAGAAVIALRGTSTAYPVDEPLPAITAGGNHFGVVTAEAKPFVFANRTNNVPKDVTVEPVPTIVTSGNITLTEPEVRPFVFTPRHADPRGGPQPRSVDEPIPTLTTSGSQFGVVEPEVKPFVLGQQSDSAPRSVDAPLMTISTAGAITLVEPGFVVGIDQTGANCHYVSPLSAPLRTIVTKRNQAVVHPFIAAINHADGDDGRVKAVSEPLDTITGKRGMALVGPAMIAPHYSHGSGLTCHSVDEPLPTVTTKARFALVQAIVGEAPADLAAAVAAKRLIVDEHGHLGLLCLPLRMLANPELAAATSFTTEQYSYEFAGTTEEVTRQIGNAIPVHMAQAIISNALRPKVDELLKEAA